MQIAPVLNAVPLFTTAVAKLELARTQMATPEQFPIGSISATLTAAHDAYLGAVHVLNVTHPRREHKFTERVSMAENLLGHLKADITFYESRGTTYRNGDFADNTTVDVALREARKALQILNGPTPA
ncbi:MAG: hypothetical protein JWO69_500 [Thermoleophilia bacterium]|jgi:hypothetical protein|nr:hypothetical protein [Thermoleophilia bacterium]